MPTFSNTSTGRSGTIQEWVVPNTTMYRIEAWGAQGGTAGAGAVGGKGAFMSGDFELIADETIKILVGQMGIGGNNSQSNHWSGGGGGGSFVTRDPHNTNNSILVVAGGGGGGYIQSSNVSNGIGGSTGTAGTAGQGGVAGGTAGGAGTASNSGGASGFFTNGANSSFSYVNGGTGGLMNTGWGDFSLHGGFGGGGGAGLPSGGGGGYSGGGSGTWSSLGAGGGGGSYNSGTNQTNQADENTGHGLVVITQLNEPPTAPTLIHPVTTTIDWTDVNQFAWDFNDPDVGDTQSRYRIQIREVI